MALFPGTGLVALLNSTNFYIQYMIARPLIENIRMIGWSGQ
jgi:hypothetical protein